MTTKTTSQIKSGQEFSFDEFKRIILNDYRIAFESREASLLGRREVLTGKAKFGIFGDGKEVAQLAMAKVFREGDFRSGYYRDQTFMFSIGALNLQEWFAALYGHTDVEAEPASAGRQMGGHYSTRSLNPDGSWKNLAVTKNSSADISPTASQMPRLLGLALASKLYRTNPELHEKKFQHFSIKGNEVAFGTIGDASTSEGLFWESINAGGVLQVPMIISIWDDGYGISVPKKYQTTKEDIGEILKGFQRNALSPGYEIFKVKGWDYPALCETYEKAIAICRKSHVPVIIHVEELAQPQGHSTSGSHERYKSKDRLAWEAEFDCIKKMREWILSHPVKDNGIPKFIAGEEELEKIEAEAKQAVREAKQAAWSAFLTPIKEERTAVVSLMDELAKESINASFIEKIKSDLLTVLEPIRKDLHVAIKKVLRITRNEDLNSKAPLGHWLKASSEENADRYNSFLHSNSGENALLIKAVEPEYDEDSKLVDAREILRDNFDAILSVYPEVVIFGEDAGKIGDVNQGLEGLQSKFGELRITDAGIREATIVGQGIGMAMRGLKPIAEIQYLDYLLYALQLMSDDLATVQYRTKGGQKAPLIVRTRGHRLEGIWHSGSPMGVIINALRGVYVCVPRNMTQAAGFYNTLLASDEPALIIEPLNGYRLKEKMPVNIGSFRTPLGIPEILREGKDVTVVTYGSCVRIAEEAAKQLEEAGIEMELIDVQTLLPFDLHHLISKSIEKTNRVLFLDEDVSSGASAYMLQKVVEEQGAFRFLDVAPKTLTAKDHRPPYGSDGDYFTKPSADDVYDAVYQLLHESDPSAFPEIY